MGGCAYHAVLGDDGEHARQCTQEIIDLPGAGTEKRVTVIHSFSDNPSGASATQIASVREASDRFEAADIECDVEGSSGDPAEAIIDVAADADLGGGKRSPAGKALFGSVTQTVILNAGRPVMVTGVTEETRRTVSDSQYTASTTRRTTAVRTPTPEERRRGSRDETSDDHPPA